jgi:hypothetical protein
MAFFQSLCTYDDTSVPEDEANVEPVRWVIVHVYDMRPENKWSYHLGVGVWHTGVQLFNSIEVTFGGHPGSTSGVFSVPPRSIPLPLRQSLRVGVLTKPVAEIRAILEQIALDYPGNSYHILNRNCNHFSDDLCRRLVGRGIPSYINRLAGLASLVKCWLPAAIHDSAPQDPNLVDDDDDDNNDPDSHSPACSCGHRHAADPVDSLAALPPSPPPVPFSGAGRQPRATATRRSGPLTAVVPAPSTGATATLPPGLTPPPPSPSVTISALPRSPSPTAEVSPLTALEHNSLSSFELEPIELDAL